MVNYDPLALLQLSGSEYQASPVVLHSHLVSAVRTISSLDP